MEMLRREVKWGLLGLMGVIGLVIVMSSWFTVPEGYVSVITRNGKVIGEASPGLNWKVPLIDAAHDMSVKTQRVNFEEVQSYSKDIQQSTSYISVNFRLLPTVVSKTYSNVGLNYDEVLLNTRVYKHLKETFGKYNAVEIISQRDKLSELVEQVLRDDMEPFGIMIEDVQLANIDFSESYEHAAELAATAQAKVVQAKQELEKARVDAQVQVAQAEAGALATKAKADAEAYRVKAEGEADAFRLTAQGNARADALTAQMKALGGDPALTVDYFRALSWNGTLPTTMVPGGTLPILNMK
jgi:regulator of protease activity HflC (stomatin/prohibitin superfamily)